MNATNTLKRINPRRFELIQKKHRKGLTIREDMELNGLQEIAERCVNEIAPLFDTTTVKRLAERLKRRKK